MSSPANRKQCSNCQKDFSIRRFSRLFLPKNAENSDDPDNFSAICTTCRMKKSHVRPGRPRVKTSLSSSEIISNHRLTVLHALQSGEIKKLPCQICFRSPTGHPVTAISNFYFRRISLKRPNAVRNPVNDIIWLCDSHASSARRVTPCATCRQFFSGRDQIKRVRCKISDRRLLNGDSPSKKYQCVECVRRLAARALLRRKRISGLSGARPCLYCGKIKFIFSSRNQCMDCFAERSKMSAFLKAELHRLPMPEKRVKAPSAKFPASDFLAVTESENVEAERLNAEEAARDSRADADDAGDSQPTQ